MDITGETILKDNISVLLKTHSASKRSVVFKVTDSFRTTPKPLSQKKNKQSSNRMFQPAKTLVFFMGLYIFLHFIRNILQKPFF